MICHYGSIWRFERSKRPPLDKLGSVRLGLIALGLLTCACTQTIPATISVPKAPYYAPSLPAVPQTSGKPAPQRDLVKELEEEMARTKPLLTKWIECTIAAARKLALSNSEPAPTIVSATFGVCSPQEQRYFESMLQGGMAVRFAEETKQRVRAAARDELMAHILAARAAQ